LGALAQRFGLSPSVENVNAVSAVIAAGNAVVSQQSLVVGVNAFLDAVYRIEAAAQGPIVDSLLRFAAEETPAAQFQSANTGAALLALINATKTGPWMALSANGPTLHDLYATPAAEGGLTRLTGTIAGITPSKHVALRINWDDGTVQDITLPDGATTFALEHLFADESPLHLLRDTRSIAVALQVDNAPADVAAVQVAVNDVAPTLQGASLTPLIIAGGTARLSAAFTDPGVLDNFIATIDWGDGTRSETNLAAGSHDLSQAHLYSQRGKYSVTLTLADSDGAKTTQTFAIDVVKAIPPAISRFDIDDGSKQRSMIRSFTVVFNQPVDLQAVLITLTRSDGTQYAVTTSNPSGDGLTWVLGFFGPDTIGSSLPDGLYTLRIASGAIVSALGQPLTGDYVVEFRRLFGDLNGDGDVDNADRVHFMKALASTVSSSRYVAVLDFNGDGVIDDADAKAFNARFGRNVL